MATDTCPPTLVCPRKHAAVHIGYIITTGVGKVEGYQRSRIIRLRTSYYATGVGEAEGYQRSLRGNAQLLLLGGHNREQP